MSHALLDTDTLSEVLKRKNAQVVRRAAEHLSRGHQFEFSAITTYEIKRGLKEKLAVRQLQKFEQFCQFAKVHPITDQVLERASDLWGEARRTGKPCSDPDLIIAATALIAGYKLVTGNRRHFDWITGLAVEDWRT